MKRSNAIDFPKLSYSMQDCMDVLGVSRVTVYKLIATGKLRTYKIGKRRFSSTEAVRDCIATLEADSAA